MLNLSSKRQVTKPQSVLMIMPPSWHYRQIKKTAQAAITSGIILSLAACSTPSGLSSKDLQSNIEHSIPKQWQQTIASELVTDLSGWLAHFSDPALEQMITYALKHNQQLKAQAINVELAAEALNISLSSDLPALSLAVDNSRRKQVTSATTSYQSSATINVDLRYEVDIWGKLSAEQKQRQFNYAAAKAHYQQARLDLITNITRTWFNTLEAKQLLLLFKQRATNLANNLEMIDSGYKLGLNDALDVYLTKNSVNQELARVAQQQQLLITQRRELELLLGDYPAANINIDGRLKYISSEINFGIPAHLLTRRGDLQASWLELLALDQGLAVAHKQRFPSVNINANLSDSDNQLSELLSKGPLAWSLIGSITTPLFNSGRLASQQQQAKLAVQQKEQQYLQQVYRAFATAENSISERQALSERYQYYLLAQDNALSAEKLSFEQYQRGLVSYTTVLESQRRSFDAQTTVIQLANQLLQNRVAIYSALGGDYLPQATNHIANPFHSKKGIE